jgi:putative endonuclease
MAWYVYILASKKNGTLYIGVTNNLNRRIYEHKEWLVDWFTRKYDVKKLVYYEECWDIKEAIQKEK